MGSKGVPDLGPPAMLLSRMRTPDFGLPVTSVVMASWPCGKGSDQRTGAVYLNKGLPPPQETQLPWEPHEVRGCKTENFGQRRGATGPLLESCEPPATEHTPIEGPPRGPPTAGEDLRGLRLILGCPMGQAHNSVHVPCRAHTKIPPERALCPRLAPAGSTPLPPQQAVCNVSGAYRSPPCGAAAWPSLP